MAELRRLEEDQANTLRDKRTRIEMEKELNEAKKSEKKARTATAEFVRFV